jgi:hypothetical protein
MEWPPRGWVSQTVGGEDAPLVVDWWQQRAGGLRITHGDGIAGRG